LKKAYTSNAGDNTIGVVDLRQMKVIKKIRTEAKPATAALCCTIPQALRLWMNAAKRKPSSMSERRYFEDAAL